MGVKFLKQMSHWSVLEAYHMKSKTSWLLSLNTPPSQYRYVWLRALFCRDVTSDLIIGLPSIQFYDLLPLLLTHILQPDFVVRFVPYLHTLLRLARRTATVTLGPTGEKNQGDDTVTSVRSIPQDGPLPILLPPHHPTYNEPMATMAAAASCGSWH